MRRVMIYPCMLMPHFSVICRKFNIVILFVRNLISSSKIYAKSFLKSYQITPFYYKSIPYSTVLFKKNLQFLHHFCHSMCYNEQKKKEVIV